MPSKIDPYKSYGAKLISLFARLMFSSESHSLTDLSRMLGCSKQTVLRLLNDITRAFTANPGLPNLLLDEVFKEAVMSRQGAWREVVQTAVGLGIPMLATGASLAYFDAYRSENLPANLTQAQRDYFGAHTYRRVDRDGAFHTHWETLPS